MKNYDIAVIGKGASSYIINQAAEIDLRVAVIDRPPIGGTCMNFGCIPSKTLIYPADRIRAIKNSDILGIEAKIEKANFIDQLEKVRQERAKHRQSQKQFLSQNKNIDYYSGEGYFIDKYTLEVEGKRLTGDKIFLANGARPFIPPIRGIDKVDYLTNESILELTTKPESIVIIGGGYISLEYAHILSAFDIEVTILERQAALMSRLEPEISELLQAKVEQYTNLYLGTSAQELIPEDGVTVLAEN